MAQEVQRTGASGIGPRLKNSDQIADPSLGQLHGAAQNVQRCTERTDYIHSFRCRCMDPVGNDNRKVTFDDLTQISRGCEVVIHTPIQNQVLPGPRRFNVIDA